MSGGGLLSGVKLKKVGPPPEKKRDPNDALADALEKRGTPSAPAVTKSDDEWKAQLTPDEYAVIRSAGTEAAHTGEYAAFHPQVGEGHFACRACKHPLYSAAAKFESGCGWCALLSACAMHLLAGGSSCFLPSGLELHSCTL